MPKGPGAQPRRCCILIGMIRSIVLLCALLALPLSASAQALDSSLVPTDPLSAAVSPADPAPYGTATISLSSTMLDLSSATVTATAGGKQVYHGDAGPITVSLGGAGSVTLVHIAATANGVTYTQDVTIQPQDLTLVAEPLSYAPPLYPGQPLVPVDGSTRVVAVAGFRDAGGRAISPAALSYAWTIDGQYLANYSGIGRSSLIVASPLQYRSRTVSVTVKTVDGSLSSSADLSLSPATPTVRLYAVDPLLGIRFDRALAGSYAITGAEADLYAAPYSFPLAHGAPQVVWTLNGATAQTGPIITLRPSGQGSGNAALAARIGSALTMASADLSLTFDASGSTNAESL